MLPDWRIKLYIKSPPEAFNICPLWCLSNLFLQLYLSNFRWNNRNLVLRFQKQLEVHTYVDVCLGQLSLIAMTTIDSDAYLTSDNTCQRDRLHKSCASRKSAVHIHFTTHNSSKHLPTRFSPEIIGFSSDHQLQTLNMRWSFFRIIRPITWKIPDLYFWPLELAKPKCKYDHPRPRKKGSIGQCWPYLSGFAKYLHSTCTCTCPWHWHLKLVKIKYKYTNRFRI